MAQATMTVDLLEALRTRHPEMSVGQRRIADFVVQHEDEAQYLTAAQLGAQVGMSESAVVRFAQFLGFSGYPELRRAICLDFRARAVNSIMLFSGRAALKGKPDLIREIAHRDASLVQETALHLDPAMLQRCADAIVAARQVFVTGHRASYALAEYLAGTLRQGIGVGTQLAFGTGMAFDTIGTAKPEDVLVAVSITPYSQQTVDLLCAAKQRGLYCVAITDHPLGAPAMIADEAILFETGLHVFTSSYVGVMTIIHILLAMIGERAGERADALLAIVDPLNEAYGTRYQPDGRNPCGKATDQGVQSNGRG